MGCEVSEAWLSSAVLRTTLLCPTLGEIRLSVSSNAIEYRRSQRWSIYRYAWTCPSRMYIGCKWGVASTFACHQSRAYMWQDHVIMWFVPHTSSYWKKALNWKIYMSPAWGLSLHGPSHAGQFASNARLLDWHDQSDFPGPHQSTSSPGGGGFEYVTWAYMIIHISWRRLFVENTSAWQCLWHHCRHVK